MRRIIFLLTALLFLQAGLSVSTPAQSPLGVCPTISVECPDTVEADGETTINARVTGANPNLRLSYEWTVSDRASIVSGQGTPSLVASIPGGTFTTITLKVNGLPANCPNQASCTITGGCTLSTGRLFDQYGELSPQEEAERLGNLSIQLYEEQGAQSYVIAYAGRRARSGEAEAQMERIRKYLVETLGIDPGRVVTVDGGYREEAAVELWIVKSGQRAPVASPTIRPEDAEIIDRPAKLKPGARRNR